MLSAEAENGLTFLYTLPVEHIFWLEECDLSPWDVGPGVCAVYYRDLIDAAVRGLTSITIITEIGAVISDHAVFPSFLKIPAGYDICVVSDAVGLAGMGSISGFLTSDYA